MAKPSRKKTLSIQNSLEKNIKELRCLHEVARISVAPEKTINERLTEIVEILPAAFEHPENIWARIVNGQEEFRPKNYHDTGCFISVDIVVQREKSGAVEIGSVSPAPTSGAGVIASQEILLVDAVAERLGSTIEHWQSQEALRESEEKFSKAFRAIPEAVAIVTLDSGIFLEVNDTFVNLNGFTRDEIIGRNATELNIWVNLDDRNHMRQLMEKSGRFSNEEYLFRRKSGEHRNVLFSGETIYFDGRPCMLTIGSDITEQKHSQEFLQSLSSSSPLAVYIMQDEKLKYLNQQFQTMTGYTQQEMLNTDLLNIVHSADKDVVRASTLYTLKDEKYYPCEYRILHKNGQVKWVMQMAAPMHYDNRDAVLGSLMDITERKYLERKVIEYEELDKMKGDILATVSHELRTPLAAIKGYATMMLDHHSRISADETMEYLISINNSTDRLIILINNLLDTSRLDSGMLELKKAPASISALIKAVVKTAAARITSHRIEALLPPALPHVNIDSKRITQVLENLIFNAAEHSPAGAIITISAVKKDHNIEVSVTDHGTVIPANELKSMFDRMYKVENREYSGAEGMGLGLHICQRLVEAHGGAIWAESSPGADTTIRFTIPGIPHEKRIG